MYFAYFKVQGMLAYIFHTLMYCVNIVSKKVRIGFEIGFFSSLEKLNMIKKKKFKILNKLFPKELVMSRHY